jgi:hypothetical protein
MFTTPVLLIVFNRPAITRQALAAIRRVKPRYLYVAADGPRPDKPDDLPKCIETRNLINTIDWECEVKTLFRDENRGCGHGPAEAITWFFDQVEMGIILEDDCLPALSFFGYCAELLEKFKDNDAIWILSGSNPLRAWYPRNASYLFSVMGGTWGWATWRRAWRHFDYSAALWKTDQGRERVRKTFGEKAFYEHFASEFDTYFATERRDVWDFQWYFCRLYHGGYSVVPTRNLISNVGSGEDATHTFDAEAATVHMPLYELSFPLKGPEFRLDRLYDRLVFERFINPAPRSLFKKVLLKTARILTKTN